jgi:hypothetical protein
MPFALAVQTSRGQVVGAFRAGSHQEEAEGARASTAGSLGKLRKRRVPCWLLVTAPPLLSAWLSLAQLNIALDELAALVQVEPGDKHSVLMQAIDAIKVCGVSG